MRRQRTELAKAIFADGRTGQEIAQAAGVNVCTMSQIANGWRNPSLETVLRLAKALGTTPKALGLSGVQDVIGGAE
jgi:transcriptional regulator with XRE-family HTH domain